MWKKCKAETSCPFQVGLEECKIITEGELEKKKKIW